MLKGGDDVEEEKRKALQELLKILSDYPEVADRITITIRPNKLSQGKSKPTESTESKESK